MRKDVTPVLFIPSEIEAYLWSLKIVGVVQNGDKNAEVSVYEAK